MNRIKKTARITLMIKATVREYNTHINKNELQWNDSSYSIKNVKQFVDSVFMLSTALCIELAPSAPLSARPGPSIAHYTQMSNNHTYQRGNKDCAEAEAHAASCRREETQLYRLGDLAVDWHAKAAVAETCKQGALSSNSLESQTPVV